MNDRMARHVVNILIESPFYLGLTLEERRRLITEFVAHYTLVPDDDSGRESTQAPDANAE